MDKKNMLIELLDFALDVKTDLENKFTQAEKNAFGTWDTWSLKDTMAHIAHWLDRDLKNIEMEHDNIPVINEGNIEDENKKIYEKWKKKSWSDIGGFCQETYVRAKKLVQSMNENRLLSDLKRADGSTRTIWQTIAGNALSHTISHISHVYRKQGGREVATALEEETAALLYKLDDTPTWRATVQYNLACNYALGGQNTKAISLLKQALHLDSNLIEWSRKDPDLENLRGDSDFAKLYDIK